MREAIFRNRLFKVRLGIAKGKIQSIERGSRIEHSDGCAYPLIEGGTEIVQSIGSNRPELWRDFVGNLSPHQIEAGIRVVVHELGIWVTIKEGPSSCVKLLSIFSSAIEQEEWAIEGVRGRWACRFMMEMLGECHAISPI